MPQRNKHPMRQGAFYALSLALLAGSAIGGSLDSPAAPDQAASAMYTLDDIYNKLDTRTPAAAPRIANRDLSVTFQPLTSTLHCAMPAPPHAGPSPRVPLPYRYIPSPPRVASGRDTCHN